MNLKGIDLARAMQADPNFAKLVMNNIAQANEMSQASQLAKDYAGVEDFLRRKEEARRADYNNTPFQGQIPLRQPEFQELTPLQQWRNRNSALMASGNPKLQEEAINQFQAINEAGIPDNDKMSASARIALDLGYKPGTKPFKDFVLNHSMKTTQNYENSLDKMIPTSEYDKFQMPDGGNIPNFITYRQAKELGVTSRNKVGSGKEGSSTMIQTAQMGLPELENILYGKGENKRTFMDPKIVREMNILDMTKGKWYQSLGDAATSPSAQLAYNMYDIGNKAITRLETGAALASEEIGHTITRFFPGTFESKEAQNRKFLAFKYFINNASKLFDPNNPMNRGLTDKQILDRAAEESLKMGESGQLDNMDSSMPDVSNRKPGDQWTEGGETYRMTEDGRIQRKRK